MRAWNEGSLCCSRKGTSLLLGPQLRRAEINPQVLGESFNRGGVYLAGEELQQVILTGLTEGQTVRGHGTLESVCVRPIPWWRQGPPTGAGPAARKASGGPGR
jgi:hypothetical protein